MWGISVFPEAQKAKTAWGARAIMEHESFGLLPDRQSWAGDEEPRQALCHWIDTTGLRLLRKQVKATGLTQDSREVLIIESPRYRLKATPNASYGYLYIAAWEKESEGERERPADNKPLPVADEGPEQRQD